MLEENLRRIFKVLLTVGSAVAFVRAATAQQSPITEIIDRSWLAATEFQQYPGTYAYPEHPAAAGAYLPPMTAPYRVPQKNGDVVVHTPYHFLVYLPQGYGEPARKWPLIVLLPDHPAATGNPAPLAEEYLLRYVREQALPFIVLIPQCPELELWQADAVKTCIDQVAAGYAVDANRIYATGYGCKGGFGLWALAVKYPDLFAAVAPISGIAPISGNSYHERDAKLVGVPVWIFAGADDTTVPAACLQREAASLRAAGVNAKLTLFPGVGHNAWSAAYRQRPLYDWFLKQSRAVAANARPRVADEVDPHPMIVRAAGDRAVAAWEAGSGHHDLRRPVGLSCRGRCADAGRVRLARYLFRLAFRRNDMGPVARHGSQGA